LYGVFLCGVMWNRGNSHKAAKRYEYIFAQRRREIQLISRITGAIKSTSFVYCKYLDYDFVVFVCFVPSVVKESAFLCDSAFSARDLNREVSICLVK
jgi:hypothetical protein